MAQVLAASVVEDEVAKMTGLTAMNIEATQRLRAATRTPEAQGKAERIMDIVASITRVRRCVLFDACINKERIQNSIRHRNQTNKNSFLSNFCREKATLLAQSNLFPESPEQLKDYNEPSTPFSVSHPLKS